MFLIKKRNYLLNNSKRLLNTGIFNFSKMSNNIPYKNVCLEMPKEYSDYENYEFQWG